MEIPVNFVVEDLLSEAILRKIVEHSQSYAIGYCYGKSGYGYIKKRVNGFNNAAKGTPYIILCDLEDECPPLQITHWLKVPKHNNLIFRIAVKETESWILADRTGFASFIGIEEDLIPQNTDEIEDPKCYLINLVQKSPKRQLRQAIIPQPNTTARVGPDYNGQLSSFVDKIWDLGKAVNNSESLRRAIRAINEFQPAYIT